MTTCLASFVLNFILVTPVTVETMIHIILSCWQAGGKHKPLWKIKSAFFRRLKIIALLSSYEIT